MPGNQFGQLFRVGTFGESHGPAIGLIIDGCPAGLAIDLDFIQKELDKRIPGQSPITTQRKEIDKVQVLSGIFEGKTTGTPIALLIPNQDQRPDDYRNHKDLFRPSHADFTYQRKYGIRDHRGGGRSSARETAARVAAGAIAKLLLRTQAIHVLAHVSSVGTIDAPNVSVDQPETFIRMREANIVRCVDPKQAQKMIQYIDHVQQKGDTVGGAITGFIINCPVGLGEPVFDKLHADLGKAILSIPAAHGFEYGSGFKGSKLLGSEHNDLFVKDDAGNIVTQTNFSGGIQGGIANGMPITFRVAFKPVSSIMHSQRTCDKHGNAVQMQAGGRHDPCVVPRAVPIVEAMAALVIADHWLRNNSAKL